MDTRCRVRRRWGLVGLLLVPCMAQAQDAVTPGRARIHGRILEQGRSRPVEGVTVTLLPANISDTTDADGRFTFEAVTAGTHLLRSEGAGRLTREDSLQIDHGASVDVLLRMTDRDRKVDEMEVAVRSYALERVGFYDRRDQEHGTFLSPQHITERRARVTSDLFRNLPSVEVSQSRTGRNQILYRRGVSCYPDVYIDGQRIGPNLDVDQLVPTELLGIEIYMAGSIPRTFTSSTCGVMVLWTRRRGS